MGVARQPGAGQDEGEAEVLGAADGGLAAGQGDLGGDAFAVAAGGEAGVGVALALAGGEVGGEDGLGGADGGVNQLLHAEAEGVSGRVEEHPERRARLVPVLGGPEAEHRRLGDVRSSTTTSRCICWGRSCPGQSGGV